MKQLLAAFHGPGTSASPAHCYVCGSPLRAGDPGIINWGVSIDMEGVLEMCVPCVEEAAGLVGAISITKTLALREENTILRKEIKRLGRRLDAFAAIERAIALASE